MRKWSERRWWHWLVMWGTVSGLTSLGAGVLVAAIQFFIGGVDLQSGIKIILFFGVLVGGLLSVVVLVWTDEKRFFSVGSGALALLDRATGQVLKAGLGEVRMKPWPFCRRYETRQYPTHLMFSCRLQPITVNPKVVPLAVSIWARIADHSELPDWFMEYLGNPAKAETKFRRQAFEAFQHRLPQELAGSLNPFDDGLSEKVIREFVVREFASLSFEHSVVRVELEMAA